MSTAASGGRLARRSALRVLSAPVIALLALFAGPLVYLVYVSFTEAGVTGDGSLTLGNFQEILGEAVYREVMLDTVVIAVTAMGILFLVAFPIATFLAFRAGRWEIPLLLAIVLTDELNPLIRIYAWRIMLARDGVINTVLLNIGVIDEPVSALMFTRLSVIIVLSTTSLSFVVVPIYAALKAVDRDLLEAARDLGAGWLTVMREVLLPLSAAGFIAAMIIVFVPMLSDFAAPAVVGGREGYMISSLIEEEFNERSDWGVGSALSFVVLGISSLFVFASVKFSKVRRVQA
jgi:spermidine/putrescine transport system permease protein